MDNPLARACGETLRARVALLSREEPQSEELEVLRRVVEFPFERYPDYTAPWHLLTWQRMRWRHVAHVVRIIESLRQPTGSAMGEPIVLQPYQVMILLAFLGPENEEGLRVVREGLMTLARKGAKTTLVAGMVLALMALHPDDHGLKGQEIQVGAADREQASIIHTMVERFVQMDNQLGIRERFRSTPSQKKIQHLRTLTTLRCLSSDAHRHHGGNPAIVLLDELGNVTSAAASEFYSVLTTGYGAQREPLTLMFSTQAPTDQHFFSQQVDRAKRVNTGDIAAHSFAGFVFTVPETKEDGKDSDPFDENFWYLANPGLDTITSIEDIRDWKKRVQDMPSLENKFRLLKLNQRVSETEALISRTAWVRNTGVLPSLADMYDWPCVLGLDLSETTDLTALVAVFIDPDAQTMPVIPWCWIPGNDLQGRVHRDHVPYDVWVKQGLLDASSHQVVDYGLVADRIVQLISDYDVRCLGFDRWKMKYLRSELRDRGYDWDDEDGFLVPVGQGFRDASVAVNLVEEAILKGTLVHGGNPLLTWAAANVVVAKDPAGNRKWEKSKSYGRIDPIVALGNALYAMSEMRVMATGPSVYEDDERSVIM